LFDYYSGYGLSKEQDKTYIPVAAFLCSKTCVPGFFTLNIMAKKTRKKKRKAKQNKWKSVSYRQKILHLLKQPNITPSDRDYLTKCYGDKVLTNLQKKTIKHIELRIKSVRG